MSSSESEPNVVAEAGADSDGDVEADAVRPAHDEVGAFRHHLRLTWYLVRFLLVTICIGIIAVRSMTTAYGFQTVPLGDNAGDALYGPLIGLALFLSASLIWQPKPNQRLLTGIYFLVLFVVFMILTPLALHLLAKNHQVASDIVKSYVKTNRAGTPEDAVDGNCTQLINESTGLPPNLQQHTNNLGCHCYLVRISATRSSGEQICEFSGDCEECIVRKLVSVHGFNDTSILYVSPGCHEKVNSMADDYRQQDRKELIVTGLGLLTLLLWCWILLCFQPQNT